MTTPDATRRDGAGGDTPPPPSRAWWRSLIGVAAVFVGIALVVTAVVVWQRSVETPDTGTDFVVSAPASELQGPQVPDGPELPAPQPTQDSAAPAIPFASGLLSEIPLAEPPLTPVRLAIPSLEVSAEIRTVGLDGDSRAMEVPRDAETVGWYRFGSLPGQSGSAVLAAHVTWHGERGPFFSLGDLDPGATIEVEFSDGSVVGFQAASRSTYAKPDLPTARIFAQDVPPILYLITCGGDYDRNSRSYDDNVVVTAVVADGSDAVYGNPQ